MALIKTKYPCKFDHIYFLIKYCSKHVSKINKFVVQSTRTTADMNIYRNTKNISNVKNIKRKVIQDVTHEFIFNHRNAFQTVSTGQINTKVDLRIFAATESKLKE